MLGAVLPVLPEVGAPVAQAVQAAPEALAPLAGAPVMENFSAISPETVPDPSAEPLSEEQEPFRWRLPDDPDAGPVDIRIRPGQLLRGNPHLFRPDFLAGQNLLGERRRVILEDYTREDEFTFYFRRNRTDLDPAFLWNPDQMSLFDKLLGRDIHIDSVMVYAFASPEGNYEHNVWLSRERAEVTRRYILEKTGVEPGRVQVCHQEENWPGLRKAVSDFYTRGNREQLLDILRARGLSDESRKQRIRDLDGGATYKYLIDTLMPPLRSAVFSIRWAPIGALDEIEPLDMVRAPRASADGGLSDLAAASTRSAAPAVELNPEWAEKTILALKTNVLYDAVTAFNYSIEVPIGDRFSLCWEHYFPWWSSQPDLKYCLQYLTLGGEARWWFAPQPAPRTDRRMIRDRLTGHFLGLYGFWGKSDIQWERTFGMYQCAPVISAGLSYGYSFPLTRHWNMELSLSVGYARIPYQHYIPADDWQVLWRDKENQGVLHYFGPTQVKVSLVRPIVIKYRVR